MIPEDDIVDAVRKRPGMYIGDVHDGSGLHHMVFEVVANSIDEYLAGRCTRIGVTLHGDGSISIADNGGGISTDLSPDGSGRTHLETIFTTSHTTPTRDGHTPHVHVMSHGVGLAPVNALSEWLEVTIRRGGEQFGQRFERGRAVSALLREGECTTTGVSLRFKPDATVFARTDFASEKLTDRLGELAFVCAGLAIDFHDERVHQFRSAAGLPDLVVSMAEGSDTVLAAPLAHRAVHGRIDVDLAMNWLLTPKTETYGRRAVRSFVNVEQTRGGGTHEAGLRDALRDVFGAREGNAYQVNLVAALHVRLADPRFCAPTKDKLESPDVRASVRQVVASYLREALDTRTDIALALRAWSDAATSPHRRNGLLS